MGVWSTRDSQSLLEDAEDAAGGVPLQRALGAPQLVVLGIGATIGAGIFVITGQAAASSAGPAVVLSFVLAGFGCALAGLCYAELSSMIPVSGSAYTYAYATLGELPAWVIGWDLVLEYLFAASTVAVGWSGYFTDFLRENLGIAVPVALSSAPFDVAPGTSHELVRTGAIVNLPAVALVVLLTLVLVRGIRHSAWFNAVVVAVKVAVVLLVIGVGALYVDPANWRPFVPENQGAFGAFGWSGVVRGAGLVFFAYIGFDAVSTAAQETRRPQRDLPIGILVSLVVCTILYVLMALVMTGLAPYGSLGVPHPVAVAVAAAGPALAWLGWVVKIGAIAGLASVVLVSLLGQSRVFYAMSRDGLLPPGFGAVHARYRTPAVATLVIGAAAAVVAGLFPIGLLGELVSIGTLLAFVIVCAGVLVLRWRRPELPRPFRVPLVPLVPLLGIACCGAMMYGLPPGTWMRLALWLLLGLAIYFGYGRFHSKAGRAAGGAP